MAKFRLDLQALEKNIQQQAQQLVQDRVDDIVSGQYCPKHGEFAKITIKDEHVVADGRLAFSYSCCCAELRAAVDKALQDIGMS